MVSTTGAVMIVRRSWVVLGVGVTTLLTVLLACAHRLDPLQEGLDARYFFHVDRTGAPIRSLIEAAPSTDRLKAAWRGAMPTELGAAWDGAFLILAEDTYTFATVSDDGSHVFVDGQLVVDNGGGAHAH